MKPGEAMKPDSISFVEAECIKAFRYDPHGGGRVPSKIDHKRIDVERTKHSEAIPDI